MVAGEELDPLTDVRKWLASNQQKHVALLDRFEMELRLGRLSVSSASATNGQPGVGGSLDRRLVTSRTLSLLRTLIGETRWKNPAQLMGLLRGLGKELHAVAGFREPAIGNIVRRVMAAVREEVMNDNNENTKDSSATTMTTTSTQRSSQLSLQSILWAHPQQIRRANTSGSQRHDSFSEGSSLEPSSTTTDWPPQFYVHRPHLKQAVMEAIQEIMTDLEDMHKNINEQALNHIHAGEVILTYGQSKTIELFLKAAAAKKRTFQVVVCEGAPHFSGHDMAKSLAESGIDTIVINDSATFAVMARVNKVLLSSHAVLANGGLIGSSGSNMVSLAAKNNSVPVVCITGLFKLCPKFPHEGQDTLNDLVSPSSIIDYAELKDELMAKVEFVNPVHDYIAPELINLYVTNIGAFQPSYIYRLLAEYYHSDDWESFE